jgi:hypothetical protein
MPPLCSRWPGAPGAATHLLRCMHSRSDRALQLGYLVCERMWVAAQVRYLLQCWRDLPQLSRRRQHGPQVCRRQRPQPILFHLRGWGDARALQVQPLTPPAPSLPSAGLALVPACIAKQFALRIPTPLLQAVLWSGRPWGSCSAPAASSCWPHGATWQRCFSRSGLSTSPRSVL